MSAAKAVISVHFGQAGIQVGQSLWELYAEEHGLGRLGVEKKKQQKHELREVFFDENCDGRFHPRLLYIDLEPSVIDFVQSVSNYNPTSLVIGQEDAANNYARGYHCTPKWFTELCDDGIRHWMERSDGIQGMMFAHSLCGGTGGGFASMYIKRLQDFFPNVMKFGFQLYPSPQISSTVVEPFNALSAINQLSDTIDVAAILDNESVIKINQRLFPTETITHRYMNAVISQFIGGVTSPLRFDGKLNVDIREFQTNLVPFSRLHYMVIGHAPWFSACVQRPDNTSIRTITSDTFNHDGWSVTCNPEYGKYIASSLNYRGIIPGHAINTALAGVRKRFDVEFVDWSPTGFKIGIHSEPPKIPAGCKIEIGSQSCTMLANHTALRYVYRRIAHRFDSMFAKQAFLHWYQGCGMENDEFIEAREYLMQLDGDYWDAQKVSISDDEED